MRALVSLAAGALAVAAVLLPAAAEVPGQRVPALADAIATWLDDDEATALAELSRLAAGGNAAAQMLLGLIDKTPPLQGPWLARLPRAERLALMRAPGGMSGTSWMQAAAAAEPSAGLWLQLWDVRAPAQLALDFAAAGEPRAAREALVAMAARERRGFAEIAGAPGYPPSMRYLVWHEWGPGPARDAEVAALHPGDPDRKSVV